MDIGFLNQEITYYQRSEYGSTAFEAVSETVVPDVMPDICEIVCAAGTALLRSKVFSDGVMTVSGSIQTQVLYLAETDQSPKKLELEIPFDFSRRTDASDESLFSVCVRLAYVDARAINPRKLGVRCELCADISRYDAESLVVACEQAPDDTADLCLKKDLVAADLVSGVWEKTFIVTDSFPLSGAGDGDCELLCKTVSLYGEEVRFVGTKAILKGIVQTDLLWRTAGEEIASGAFRSEFSQILDIGELEQPSAELILSLTGAFFETPYASDDSVVNAEFHVLAQVVCSQRTEIVCISDVYSNHALLTPRFCEPRLLSTAERESRRDSMRGVIETPFAVREILQISAAPGILTKTEAEYACPINVRVLLRDDSGALHGLVRSFAAKWPLSADGSVSELPLNVFSRELSASPAASGVEVRLSAAAEFLQMRDIRIEPLESAELDESVRIDPSTFPSITVLPAKEADLWALAKRCHSTVALIEEANRDLGASVLLIPRAR